MTRQPNGTHNHKGCNLSKCVTTHNITNGRRWICYDPRLITGQTYRYFRTLAAAKAYIDVASIRHKIDRAYDVIA